MPAVSPDFVKRLLRKGYRDSEIRQVLRESGFTKTEIENAFDGLVHPVAQAMKTTPALPKKPAAARPQFSPPHITPQTIMHVSFAAELLLILVFALSLPALIPEGTATGGVVVTTTNCGNDIECFKSIAQACGKARVAQMLGTSLLEFTTHDCTLMKRVASFGTEEPAHVVSVLSGKTMECAYQRNALPKELLDGLAGGIESCQGTLKDALYQLAG